MNTLALLGGLILLIAPSTCPLLAQPAAAPIPKAEAEAYVLGPGDQISVQVVELPDVFDKSYRIDSDGSVALPLIGRVQAAGLTLRQFESQLVAKVKTQVLDPHVVTGLVETRSHLISVAGEVNTPGTQQIAGEKRLFDVISAAGGLRPDAGDVIKISRRPEEMSQPLPNATRDPATGGSIAELNVRDVLDLRDPNANIVVRPLDEIFVPRAQVIYVVGDVRKPGGFTLNQRRNISALEALAEAEGLAPTASPKSARILREPKAGSLDREQIPVNLKKVLQGKDNVQLYPNDVLFVPSNTLRRATDRAGETVLSTLSGLIIWHGL